MRIRALRRNLTSTQFLRGFCGLGDGASGQFRVARSARRPMIAGLPEGFFDCDCGSQESVGWSRHHRAGPDESHAERDAVSKSLAPERGLSRESNVSW